MKSLVTSPTSVLRVMARNDSAQAPELNRYAVGVGEWVGVGSRLMSCECEGLTVCCGPVALIEAKIRNCAKPFSEPCFPDALMCLER